MKDPNAISTVQVSVMDNTDALLMVWEHRVRLKDVVAAFQTLNTLLESTQQKMYVVVDILSNPQFPMLETITEAMTVQRNPNLGGWVVVGNGTLARLIAATLKNISHEDNVRWFKDHTAAQHFLIEHRVTA